MSAERAAEGVRALPTLDRWESYEAGGSRRHRHAPPGSDVVYHVAPAEAEGATGWVGYVTAARGGEVLRWLGARGAKRPADGMAKADLLRTSGSAIAACEVDLRAAHGVGANFAAMERAVRLHLGEWRPAVYPVAVLDTKMGRYLESDSARSERFRDEIAALARLHGFRSVSFGWGIIHAVGGGDAPGLMRELLDLVARHGFPGAEGFLLVRCPAFDEALRAGRQGARNALARLRIDATAAGFSLDHDADEIHFAPLARASNPPGEGRLPFLVAYSAAGILRKGRPAGTIARVSKNALSSAIQVATKSRQKLGHLEPGTRKLTALGRKAEAKLRAEQPEKVAAAEKEFERLVELTHGTPSKTGPRAALPGRSKAQREARSLPPIVRPAKAPRAKSLPEPAPARAPKARSDRRRFDTIVGEARDHLSEAKVALARRGGKPHDLDAARAHLRGARESVEAALPKANDANRRRRLTRLTNEVTAQRAVLDRKVARAAAKPARGAGAFAPTAANASRLLGAFGPTAKGDAPTKRAPSVDVAWTGRGQNARWRFALVGSDMRFEGELKAAEGAKDSTLQSEVVSLARSMMSRAAAAEVEGALFYFHRRHSSGAAEKLDRRVAAARKAAHEALTINPAGSQKDAREVLDAAKRSLGVLDAMLASGDLGGTSRAEVVSADWDLRRHVERLGSALHPVPSKTPAGRARKTQEASAKYSASGQLAANRRVIEEGQAMNRWPYDSIPWPAFHQVHVQVHAEHDHTTALLTQNLSPADRETARGQLATLGAILRVMDQRAKTKAERGAAKAKAKGGAARPGKPKARGGAR